MTTSSSQTRHATQPRFGANSTHQRAARVNMRAGRCSTRPAQQWSKIWGPVKVRLDGSCAWSRRSRSKLASRAKGPASQNWRQVGGGWEGRHSASLEPPPGLVSTFNYPMLNKLPRTGVVPNAKHSRAASHEKTCLLRFITLSLTLWAKAHSRHARLKPYTQHSQALEPTPRINALPV